jgi:hypothetical protein
MSDPRVPFSPKEFSGVVTASNRNRGRFVVLTCSAYSPVPVSLSG